MTATHTRTFTIEPLGERAEGKLSRFKVTVSTATPYNRGGYVEVLEHHAGAINLERAPLPLIEGHDRSKVNVGLVEKLKPDGSRLRGELVLGTSARAAELAADIEAGIVSNVSVAYSIDESEYDQDTATLRVTRWTPYEVSVVSVPADIAAGINRSAPMPTPTPQGESARTDDEPAAAIAERAATAERQRSAEIRDLVRKFKLPESIANGLVDRGATPEQARAAVLDALVDRQSPEFPPSAPGYVTNPDGGIGERAGEPDFVRAAAETLALRAGVPIAKPHPGVRDMTGMSAMEIARACLSQRGERTGPMRGRTLFERAMTTSDFPNILSGAVNLALRRGYEAEPGSHVAWLRFGTVPDFRTQERVILGSAPDLAKVLESGEYTYGSLDDDKATFSVEKFGKILHLTWEAMVNDRLNAFLRLPMMFGQAARRKEADKVYTELLLANSGAGQTMQDTVALFHADHANLASAQAAFDVAALNAGRVLMRRQTALGGGLLNLAPRYLIVPPEYETQAEILVSDATVHRTSRSTAVVAGDTTTTGGSLEDGRTPAWVASLMVVTEARLATGAFYLAASPDAIDTCELAYLEEDGGPVIQERDGFNVDGREYKARLVFGARFLDWRGLVKVPLS